MTYAQAIETNINPEEIKARLEKTNQLWTEFVKVAGKIFEIDAECDAFDKTYYHAVALLNGSIHNFHPNQFNTTMNNGEISIQSSMCMMEIKYPKLHISVFQGDYQECQFFFDLFNTSVHEKTSLSAAQKLQHLKDLLRGEPLVLIRHLTITDANYIEAYQILSKIYDSKKVIINNYIETFLHVPAITRLNSSNITKLASTTDEIVR